MFIIQTVLKNFLKKKTKTIITNMSVVYFKSLIMFSYIKLLSVITTLSYDGETFV